MPDIVERLRELSRQMIRLDIDMSLPAGSVDPAEAADTITTLRAEVEKLNSELTDATRFPLIGDPADEHRRPPR